jgi:hypothetical protein
MGDIYSHFLRWFYVSGVNMEPDKGGAVACPHPCFQQIGQGICANDFNGEDVGWYRGLRN